MTVLWPLMFIFIIFQPLARMGASVTGIDAVEKNIKIAQLHAVCFIEEGKEEKSTSCMHSTHKYKEHLLLYVFSPKYMSSNFISNHL